MFFLDLVAFVKLGIFLRFTKRIAVTAAANAIIMTAPITIKLLLFGLISVFAVKGMLSVSGAPANLWFHWSPGILV